MDGFWRWKEVQEHKRLRKSGICLLLLFWQLQYSHIKSQPKNWPTRKITPRPVPLHARISYPCRHHYCHHSCTSSDIISKACQTVSQLYWLLKFTLFALLSLIIPRSIRLPYSKFTTVPFTQTCVPNSFAPDKVVPDQITCDKWQDKDRKRQKKARLVAENNK